MRRLGSLLVFLAAWLLATGAQADDRAAAESLYREAIDLARKGNFDEACSKFAASYELDKQLGTLMALAACHEEQGKTASAWADYGEAVSLARRSDNDAIAQKAAAKADALRGKLSRLKLVVTAPVPDMTVTVNDERVPNAALGSALPVDPGKQHIVVSAPHHEEWTQDVEVPAGASTKVIEVPALEAIAGGGGGASGGGGDDEWSDTRIAAWTVGIVGLVGLTVGTAFGIAAAVQASSADDRCNGKFCTQEGLDGQNRALAFSFISTTAMILGGLGVTAGVVLILIEPSPDDAAPNTGFLSAPQGAMLQVGGRW